MKEIENVPFDSMPQLITGSFLTKEQAKKIKDLFKDVVVVVRCKDCKHCKYPDAEREWCKKGHLHGNAETWFCADGERKD